MTSVQLEALQCAIEKLKSLTTLQQQNAILQQQLYEKDLEISVLRNELKSKQDPKPYKEALHKLDYQYTTAQANYEDLSMKYDEICSHNTVLLKTVHNLKKELSNRPAVNYTAKPSKSRILFVSIFKRPLKVMLECMTGSDIINLVKAYPFLAHELMSKTEVLDKLESCFGQAAEAKLEESSSETYESEEIKYLLEKHLAEGYNPTQSLETRVVNTVKTLLALQKSTEISTSSKQQQEKYKNISELVVGKFPVDKTIELLHRSAALFSTNPNKMGEWVQFMQNSLAGLLFDGAFILNEGKELSKLSQHLFSKLKESKDKIHFYQLQHENLQRVLGSEQNIKQYLVRRLHDIESAQVDRLAEIFKFKNQVEELTQKTQQIQEEKNKEKDQFETYKKTIANELLSLRERSERLKVQREELLSAFEEFNTMFTTLNLN